MRKIVILSWKKFSIIIFSLVLFIYIFISICNLILEKPVYSNKPTTTYFQPGKPTEGSLEEIYQDVFVTLLLPYIDKAVEDYYGVPYTVAPYFTKVISIERPRGYRTFGFLIKLEVTPYTGPHNTIGVDHITLRLSGPNVEIEKFEHIESFDLP